MTYRILLVEDDPVSRDLLASLVETRGHAVDSAADGFNALRLAQETRYDLVFVDYHLPEMDGYALARLMRTLGEKTDAQMKMVAITADKFGLAARRGVDSIFDCMLAKPIDPEALLAFVDEALPPVTAPDDIDDFLAAPAVLDANNAAQVLWRVRGLDALPAVAAFPAPSPAERARLEFCFRLVEPQRADCLLVLHADGLAQVANVRASGANTFAPLVAIDPACAPSADLLFEVGNADSWSAVAAALVQAKARRAQLNRDRESAADVEMRFAAFMHVSGREIILRRDPFGRTSVPYTGGFAATAVIEAIRALASRGIVVAKAKTASEDGARELVVTLTPKGLATIVDAGAAQVAG